MNQAGSWPPPSGSPPKTWISQATVVISGADLDHEHHRVADLDARVELAAATRAAPGAGSRGSNERCGRCGLRWSSLTGASLSRARLSSRTLTPGSPKKPSERPSVLSSIRSSTSVEREAAHGGDPVGLDPGVGLRDVRVDAGGGGRDRVDRDVARASGRGRRAARASGRRRVLSANSVSRSALFGPRLLKKVTSRGVAGRRGSRLEVRGSGRLAVGSAEVLADQLRADDLAVDASPGSRPPCPGRATWATPVIASG